MNFFEFIFDGFRGFVGAMLNGTVIDFIRNCNKKRHAVDVHEIEIDLDVGMVLIDGWWQWNV